MYGKNTPSDPQAAMDQMTEGSRFAMRTETQLDFADLEDASEWTTAKQDQHKLDPSKEDPAAQLARDVTGNTRSQSTTARFKCQGCDGNGYILVYRRGGGWDQIPERKPCWKGCGGTGYTKTDPATLALRRQQREDRKAANKAATADKARAFLDSRPDIRAWIRRGEDSGFQFAMDMNDALYAFGYWTDNQRAAVERCVERDRVRDEEQAASATRKAAEATARGEQPLDLSSLPSGMYAVPNGETRLKVKINRGKAGGNWAGVIFVSDGAAYGQRQNYGRQRVGGLYEGKIVEQLRAILANPREAMAAYGHLTGTCGVCGRPLEDEQSVARGIGPVCAGRVGW